MVRVGTCLKKSARNMVTFGVRQLPGTRETAARTEERAAAAGPAARRPAAAGPADSAAARSAGPPAASAIRVVRGSARPVAAPPALAGGEVMCLGAVGDLYNSRVRMAPYAI